MEEEKKLESFLGGEGLKKELVAEVSQEQKEESERIDKEFTEKYGEHLTRACQLLHLPKNWEEPPLNREFKINLHRAGQPAKQLNSDLLSIYALLHELIGIVKDWERREKERTGAKPKNLTVPKLEVIAAKVKKLIVE